MPTGAEPAVLQWMRKFHRRPVNYASILLGAFRDRSTRGSAPEFPCRFRSGSGDARIFLWQWVMCHLLGQGDE